MSSPFLTPVAGGVRLRVRLQPRSSHNRIVGLRGDALKVQVTAPPVEGEAHAALERVVAGAIAVPRSAVRVVGGAKSRDKVVEIATADGAAVSMLLERLAVNAGRRAVR